MSDGIGKINKQKNTSLPIVIDGVDPLCIMSTVDGIAPPPPGCVDDEDDCILLLLLLGFLFRGRPFGDDDEKNDGIEFDSLKRAQTIVYAHYLFEFFYSTYLKISAS